MLLIREFSSSFEGTQFGKDVGEWGSGNKGETNIFFLEKKYFIQIKALML